MSKQWEPCDESIDIGPFRFECNGHIPGARQRAIDFHEGKLTHHATSAQDVGDVDVTFWTTVDEAGVVTGSVPPSCQWEPPTKPPNRRHADDDRE